MPSPKTNIAFIGAGKISYSLSYALINSGYNISIVISRKKDSARKLARKFRIKNFSDRLEDIPFNSGILFLCVPDNQIKAVANKLSKLKINFPKSTFVHLSGALNASELSSLKKKNGQTASFHIMQTFPSKKIVSIKNCYAGIEVNNSNTKKLLFHLAKGLSLKTFEIKSEAKTFYHLAGVFASNFLVGNISNSEILFNYQRKDIYSILNIISPIIESTLLNIKKNGTANSLSGPVERGDVSTVKKHLKELSRRSNKNIYLFLSYVVQSLNLLNVVKKKYGKLSREHTEIKRILNEELKKISKRKID